MYSLIIVPAFNKLKYSQFSFIKCFIIIKTSNINEVNDIIQETYLELWNILKRRVLREENLNSFMIGIANNKIKKLDLCQVFRHIFLKDVIDRI